MLGFMNDNSIALDQLWHIPQFILAVYATSAAKHHLDRHNPEDLSEIVSEPDWADLSESSPMITSLAFAKAHVAALQKLPLSSHIASKADVLMQEVSRGVTVCFTAVDCLLQEAIVPIEAPASTLLLQDVWSTAEPTIDWEGVLQTAKQSGHVKTVYDGWVRNIFNHAATPQALCDLFETTFEDAYPLISSRSEHFAPPSSAASAADAGSIYYPTRWSLVCDAIVSITCLQTGAKKLTAKDGSRTLRSVLVAKSKVSLDTAKLVIPPNINALLSQRILADDKPAVKAKAATRGVVDTLIETDEADTQPLSTAAPTSTAAPAGKKRAGPDGADGPGCAATGPAKRQQRNAA